MPSGHHPDVEISDPDHSRGEGRIEDIDTLKSLGETLAEASLCGLGQACPKPARPHSNILKKSIWIISMSTGAPGQCATAW
ncbi:MAG: NADH-ubiquinone oxidoreductase-F iron-sulfur binding region domain-containing protein [Desulfobacterales bacterium]